MKDWQRRRANEKRKLRQMDQAFGGSMARLRAMYLDEPEKEDDNANPKNIGDASPRDGQAKRNGR